MSRVIVKCLTQVPRLISWSGRMDFEYSDEERMVQELARRLARDKIAPGAAEIDEREEFPHDPVQQLAAHGLFGLVVPEEVGGSGAGVIAFLLAVEEIVWACPGPTRAPALRGPNASSYSYRWIGGAGAPPWSC